MTVAKPSLAFESLLAELGSDASRRAYRSDWTAFTAWCKRQKLAVLKVAPSDVKRYVLHLSTAGKAARTRGRALSVIREVYRAFVAEELLKFNPAREVKDTKRGKAAKPVTWLEEEPLARMLAFGLPTCCSVCGTQATKWDGGMVSYETTKAGISPTPLPPQFRCDEHDPYNKWFGIENLWTDRHNRMVIQLLAGTGRRRSEVARMRLEDFTEHGVTGVVKGGAEKTAPVPLWLKREISDWCGFAGITTGPLLPRSPEDQDAISGDMVYLIVKRVAKAVGIDPKTIAPHGLRRSLATLSERRNVPLADIQTQLGHASRQTTETYLKGSRRVETAPGEWMSDLVKGKETP